MDIKEQVRSFLTTNFYVPESTVLANDTSLLDLGVIDSTGVLEVIEFIERTFDIRVEDSEMLPQNLDSIDQIVAFIERKNA